MFSKRAPITLWGPAVLSALVSLVPLWYLTVQATSRGWGEIGDEIFQQRTFDLVTRSLLLCAAVTAICAVIGTAAAWIIVYSGLRGRTALTIAFSLPLAIPSYLSAFAWISRWPSLSGFWGAFIVLTFATFPYAMLPVMAAMTRLDPTHEEIARSLGKGPVRIFFSVVLPQVRRALAGGSLLVALYVLSDFGAVATMRHEVFTWVIYGAYRAGFNPTRAAVLSIILVLIALVLTGAESRARGRESTANVGRSSLRAPRRKSLGVKTASAIVAGLIVIPSIGVPVAGIIDWLNRETTRAVSWSDVFSAAMNSFGIGFVVAIATLFAALPIALMVVRHRDTFSRVIEATTFITHSLPGIVIAISVVYVGIRAVRPLYQELPLVVFAHVVLFLPVMVASIKAALEKSGPVVEEVARSLGAGPIASFFRVTLPLATPGIAAGWALTMLAAVKELPATLLLRPTGFDTLSTEIWARSSVSDYAAVGPYALVILLVAAIPTAILGTLSVVKGTVR